MSDLGKRLLLFLDDGASERVRRYFNGVPIYTGGRFERLGEGGDHGARANHFTAEDIIAVSLLSVEIRGEAALELLETRSKVYSTLLAHIPVEIDLWKSNRSDVDDSSPAQELWTQLKLLPGVGPVIAGKLLARKRPHLIPIWDRYIREGLGIQHNWWTGLWDSLQSGEVVNRLARIREQSMVGEDISLLRVLDVSIWMLRGVPIVTDSARM